MKHYMVFDGRANYDVDKAMVMEVLGDMSEKRAIKEFKAGYADMDCCLFSYDEKDGHLINPQQVYM